MLITAAEFAAIRTDLSLAWSKETAKINRCIYEAEEVDLYDVLGSFYFDVVANAGDASYEDLMSGSTFEFEGEPVKHIGIKAYVAALAYARYLTLSNATHTAHGYVNKLSQDSEPVNYAAIRDNRKDVEATAEIQFVRIDKYIRSLPEIFPNYRKGNNAGINTNSVKTSTLR